MAPKNKKNPMQQKSDKHKEKLGDFDVRKSSKFGEKVINYDRVATDRGFCYLLCFVVLITVGLAIFGYTQGGNRWVAPYDPTGTMCGHGEAADYPLLYIPQDTWASAVCVTKCPKVGEQIEKYGGGDPLEPAALDNYRLGYVCVNTDTKELVQSTATEASEAGGAFLQGLLAGTAGWIIAVVTGGMFALAYLYCVANFAKQIAYCMIVMFNLLFAVMAIMAATAKPQQIHREEGEDDDEIFQNKENSQGGTMITVIVWILYDVILYCKWTQVKIAIAIVDATADFFVANKRVLLVSIANFVATCLWALFFAGCVAAIASGTDVEWAGQNTKTHQERKAVSSKTGGELSESEMKSYQILFYFLGFALTWTVFFLKETNVFTLMASVSTYYFDSNAQRDGQASVMQAVKWANVTHAGSIALGSFIHTLIKVIVQLIMDGNGEDESPMKKCKAVCCSCVEDLLEYLGKVAYAYMSITGDKYCTSAWNGFLLNLKHCTQFYLTNRLASSFVTLGTVMIVVTNVGLYHVIFLYVFKWGDLPNSRSSQEAQVGQMYGIYGSYAVVLVLSLIVVDIFIGLFDEAVVATIHCYAMDIELHGGAPAYGPPSFHEKLREIMATDEWKAMQEYEEMAQQKNEPANPNVQASAMAPGQQMQPQMGMPMQGGMVQTQSQSHTTTTTTNQQMVMS